MNSLLFWIIECLPFVKRIFYWDDYLYFVFNYLPALLALRPRIDYKYLSLYALIGVFFIIGNVTFGTATLYFVGLLPLLCKAQFDRVSFQGLFQKFYYIPAIIVIYALFQYLFGYSSFEIGWINSERGKTSAAGLFLLGDNIRPFSMLAGIPEFSFFICLLFYHEYYLRRNLIFANFAILILFSMGSRGVAVGLFCAMLVFSGANRFSKPVRFVLVSSLGVFSYIILISMELILRSFETDSSRMLVYGTFGERVEILRDFFEHADFYSILVGVGLPWRTFDNIYISVLNDFGLLGFVILIYLLYVGVKDHKSEFAIYIAMIYGMYADFVHSFFFMHLLGMMLYTKNTLSRNFKVDNKQKEELVTRADSGV